MQAVKMSTESLKRIAGFGRYAAISRGVSGPDVLHCYRSQDPNLNDSVSSRVIYSSGKKSCINYVWLFTSHSWKGESG